MRVTALLSLFFGFTGLMLLNGQTFSHAIMGIICGIVAIGSGLACARKDHVNGGRRWGGRGAAILGLGLTVYCAIQLPSAYRFQKKFNARSKEFHEWNQATPTTDSNSGFTWYLGSVKINGTNVPASNIIVTVMTNELPK
jgi:hypothetical protein